MIVGYGACVYNSLRCMGAFVFYLTLCMLGSGPQGRSRPTLGGRDKPTLIHYKNLRAGGGQEGGALIKICNFNGQNERFFQLGGRTCPQCDNVPSQPTGLGLTIKYFFTTYSMLCKCWGCVYK